MARTEVTGNQIKDGTVSLTADVTGVLSVPNGGTGSNTVALNNVVLGNGSGAFQTVAPGTSGNVLTSNGTTWTSAAAASGGTANGGYTSTATANGTTTMDNTYTQTQVFTGTAAQTVKLPTTSITAGASYTIINQSTGLVTVQSSGANTIVILAASTSAVFTAAVAAPTTAANWAYQYLGSQAATGKKLTVNNSLTLSGTDATVMTFPTTNATIARTDAAQTFTGVQTMTSPSLTTPVINGIPTGTGVATAATANTLALRDATGTITANIIETTTAVGTIGAAVTLTLAGTVQTATLTSATPCTVTMPAVSNGASFVLYLRQPATGTATTATFTGVRWGTLGAPVITAVLGRMDILTFFSDGTNWYGQYAQGYQY